MLVEEEEEEGEESEEEVKGPKWPSTVFVEEGKLQFRLGNYWKSIENFDIVLEREPTNVQILVARSRAYFQLMDYVQAMRDAEDAIKLDPRCPAAIYQKGEIQYTMGDFEFAYLTFQRGNKKRPDFEKFRFGLQKCRAAILNAVGPQSGLKITKKDMEKVEKRLHVLEKEQFSGRKASKKDVEQFDPNATIGPPVLGNAEKDKKFFNDLLTNKYVENKVDPEDRKISDCSKTALAFLTERQKFWQMEKPLHARERKFCFLRVPLSKYRTPEAWGRKIADVNVQLKRAEKVLRKDPQKTIGLCRKSIKVLEETPGEVCPGKHELMTYTLDVLGAAYKEIGGLELAIETHQNQKDLANEQSLDVAQYNAVYNLGQDYIEKGDYEAAIPIFAELLSLADTDVDRGYILKAIGQCQISLNDPQAAKDSIRRALELAKSARDIDLETESIVLFGQIEVLNGDTTAASEYFCNALELAVVSGNTEVEEEMKEALESLGIKENDDEY